MLTKSSKNYSLTRNDKSITKCIHWCKESDKVIYIDHKYSNMDWCLIGHLTDITKYESKVCLKRGTPIGSNDMVSWEKKMEEKTHEKVDTPIEVQSKNGLLILTDQSQVNNQMVLEETYIIQLAHKRHKYLKIMSFLLVIYIRQKNNIKIDLL